MSENNDGGLAERGGTSNVSGTGSNFGGSGGPTGSGGSNSANVGVDHSAGHGTSSYSPGSTNTGSTRNFTSAFPGGELLPGARAPVVPGFGFTPRRDQTLGDIQEQNRIGNANATGQNVNSSNGSAGNVSNPQKRQVVWNPVKRQYVPVPQPKPPRGLPNFTPEDMPQDYNTHIPGIQLGPVANNPEALGDPQFPGTDEFGWPGGMGTPGGIKDESQVGLDQAGGWGVGNSSRGEHNFDDSFSNVNDSQLRSSVAPENSVATLSGQGVGAERGNFNDPAFRDQRMAQLEAANRQARLAGEGGGPRGGGGFGQSPEMQAWRDARPERGDDREAFRTARQDWRESRPQGGGGGGGGQLPRPEPRPAPSPGGPGRGGGGATRPQRGPGLPGGSKAVAKKIFGAGKPAPTPAPRPRQARPGGGPRPPAAKPPRGGGGADARG